MGPSTAETLAKGVRIAKLSFKFGASVWVTERDGLYALRVRLGRRRLTDFVRSFVYEFVCVGVCKRVCVYIYARIFVHAT